MKKRGFYCWLIYVIILILCLSSCVKKDDEKIKSFGNYKSSFNEINELLMDLFNDGKNGIYGVVKDDNKITNLYLDGDIMLNDSQLKAINNIDQLFKTDFSLIYVTEERIAYGGLGTEMYVYTFNDDVPDYFYSKDGEDKFTTYFLEDNWFLLIRR